MGLFGRMFGGENKKQEVPMEHTMGHPAGGSISTVEHNMDHPTAAGTSTQAKDPVCGMDVDPKTAAARSEYQGKTYHFCAPACKIEFDKEPQKYLSSVAQNQTQKKCSC